MDREALLAFANHRVKGLAHLEGRLRPKFSKVDKEPLDLRALAVEGAPARDLPTALEHFLYVEHHAKVQELM